MTSTHCRAWLILQLVKSTPSSHYHGLQTSLVDVFRCAHLHYYSFVLHAHYHRCIVCWSSDQGIVLCPYFFFRLGSSAPFIFSSSSYVLLNCDRCLNHVLALLPTKYTEYLTGTASNSSYCPFDSKDASPRHHHVDAYSS